MVGECLLEPRVLRGMKSAVVGREGEDPREVGVGVEAVGEGDGGGEIED